jgi:hypothetical protein
MGYVQTFIDAYVECALWSTIEYDGEGNGGDPLDENYMPDDLAPEALTEMRKDCLSFIWTNRAALRESGQDAGQSGHDFWLTRNGHGAGFWDRGLGDVGEELTRASKPYGSCDLYVGDDGRIYAQ